MGKRSRKQLRPDAGARPAPVPASPAPRPVDERPKAPWHPVPLVELCVLIGIVLIVAGFFFLEERRGGILIVSGLALASLAGLDTVVREHFAGFRSHSTLLAGVPTVLVTGTLYFSRAPIIALLVAAVVVFAASFTAFRRAFTRRSGGLSFR